MRRRLLIAHGARDRCLSSLAECALFTSMKWAAALRGSCVGPTRGVGRITEIHFTDGADLKKGDALFTIDPRPFQAQLNAAEANLVQSRAALDFAKIQFARVKDLVESRAIARQDYDTRKNAVDLAEAQVKQNEAAVDSARLNLEYTAIRSPIDGRADTGSSMLETSSPQITARC